jgi:N-methylhydantoinase A/oxoprolinase/acetone carboxylase beta subunit
VLRGQDIDPTDVSLVGLSTTLATNAIVEGRDSPICLLLIGYDPELIRQYRFERDLVTQDVVYLHGGHDGAGNEVAPLDEAAAREAILSRRNRVEAFAVSGYFGVRNPTHELRVRALVEELSASANGGPIPVTCGHELTTRLNAVRRATTTALNARLIPLLQELIATVRDTLDVLGVTAPLMVVKGNGSLVRAEWAMQRPIETILSGPAASVIGAWHLAGRRDVWVVDVGGTTTDIAVLRDGRPRLNPEGAQVGEWKTMVEAVDVHTVGLGGDSLVHLDAEGRLAIGPRRVIPLCTLAVEHPQIVDELRRQLGKRQRRSPIEQFVMAQRRAPPSLPQEEQALLQHLFAGPQPLATLLERLHYGPLVMRRIEKLEAQRLVARAGFTPTDALHVLGRFERWNTQASKHSAKFLAARMNLSPQAFCERVASEMSNRVTTEVVTKALGDEGEPPDWERDTSAAALLARALGEADASDLDCQLRLVHPIVAIGAPVQAYLPRVAQQLNTNLVIPHHAEVGNAVGAVAGGVVLQKQVLIHPLDIDHRVRLHLPDGVYDAPSVTEGIRYAQKVIPPMIRALARQAGAEQVEVQMTRVDREAPVQGKWGEKVYLGTELTFIAIGRPSITDGHESNKMR